MKQAPLQDGARTIPFSTSGTLSLPGEDGLSRISKASSTSGEESGDEGLFAFLLPFPFLEGGVLAAFFLLSSSLTCISSESGLSALFLTSITSSAATSFLKDFFSPLILPDVLTSITELGGSTTSSFFSFFSLFSFFLQDDMLGVMVAVLSIRCS